MNSSLNTDLLSSMIKSKRGKRPLREIAKEIGDVSAPTLSRVEQGKLPDVDTFIKLCKWLEVQTDTFVVENASSDEGSSEQKVIAHLRADRELSPETVEMLVRVINLAYTHK